MTKNQAKPNYVPFAVLQFVSLTSIVSGSMMFLVLPWLCIQITGQASAAVAQFVYGAAGVHESVAGRT